MLCRMRIAELQVFWQKRAIQPQFFTESSDDATARCAETKPCLLDGGEQCFLENVGFFRCMANESGNKAARSGGRCSMCFVPVLCTGSITSL